MKSLTLFTVGLVLALSSCRNTALKLASGGSTLQGVYDDDYSLRIGRVSGESNLYQFETCLTQVHLSKKGSTLSSEESCVPALQERGESITFNAVPAADKLILGEEEQRSLLKMQREWGEYKKKQKDFLPYQQAGATLGGAVVIGNAINIAGLHSKAQKARVKLGKAEVKGQKILDETLDVDSSQEPNWYKKILGTVDKERAVEELLETEKKINNYGYNTEGTRAFTQESLEATIFSDSFVKHMKSDEIAEYLAKNNIQDDVWSILKNPSNYSDRISFGYIVERFVAQGYNDLSDIIHWDWQKEFAKYCLDSDVYDQYKDPLDSTDFIEGKKYFREYRHHRYIDKRYNQRNLSLIIEDIESFRNNRGVPSSALRDMKKNKVILEGLRESFPGSVLNNNKSMDLGDTIRVFKKSKDYVDPARKLVKKSAEKMTRAIRRSAAVIIVGAAATVAVLRYKGEPVREAKEAVDTKELNFDQLGVLLQEAESSPLMSMDPYNNVEVPSIKDVLIYLSVAWGRFDFENHTTTCYCFPELQDKDTVTAHCRVQGSSG